MRLMHSEGTNAPPGELAADRDERGGDEQRRGSTEVHVRDDRHCAAQDRRVQVEGKQVGRRRG